MGEAGVAAPATGDLKDLASRARLTFGLDRANDITALVRALDAMQPTEANANAITELLASGDLDGLAPAQGLDLRAHAVGRLLELGYPWALSVDPEDLEYFRESVRQQGGPRWLKVIREGPISLLTGLAAMGVGAGVLAAQFAELPIRLPTGGTLTDSMAATMVLLWGLFLLVGNFKEARRRAVLSMAALLPALVIGLGWVFSKMGSGVLSLIGLIAVATPLFVASLAAGLALPKDPPPQIEPKVPSP